MYRVGVMRVGINLINFGPGASSELPARSAELAERRMLTTLAERVLDRPRERLQ